MTLAVDVIESWTWFHSTCCSIFDLSSVLYPGY